MRRTLCIFLPIILLLCSFCFHDSTNKPKEKTYNRILKVDGIENFDIDDGNYILNYHILPPDDFLEKFNYKSADYHYREHYESYWDFVGYEKSIVVIKYDEKTYEKAKEFCFKEMMLSETYSLNYNGYTFIENVELAIGQDDYTDDYVRSFPQKFNLFCYNDNLHCIIFLGFYCPDYTNEDAMLVIKNWGEFLDKHFSDVYSFE